VCSSDLPSSPLEEGHDEIPAGRRHRPSARGDQLRRRQAPAAERREVVRDGIAAVADNGRRLAAAKALEVDIPHNYPVLGKDAFETGTGVHAAAVIKAFRKGDIELADAVYSGVPAGMVGLQQTIAVGPMSGKSNATFVLERLGIDPTEARVQAVLAAGKTSKRLLSDDEIRAVAGSC
jgi:hypothetical protein